MIFTLVRCRDDAMPKTVDTRSHCKVWLRACNNLPQQKNTDEDGDLAMMATQYVLNAEECDINS